MKFPRLTLIALMSGIIAPFSVADPSNVEKKGPVLVLKLESKKIMEGQGFRGTLHLVNRSPNPINIFDYADLKVNLVHEDGTPVKKTTNMGFGKIDRESLKKRVVTCPKNGSLELVHFDPHTDKPSNKLVYTCGRGRVGWQLVPGKYKISVTLTEDGALPDRLGIKGVWTGTLRSNEIAFQVSK